MNAVGFTALLLIAAAGLAHAQTIGTGTAATLSIEFDNRGQKVMSKDTNAKIVEALCKKVFLTLSCKQVEMAGGMGQSSLLNHKSVVMYTAVGPTTNGKTVLANCQAAIKKGWLGGSNVAKSLEKATDTWMPGDSVKVKQAVCTTPVSGRKLLAA